MWDFHVLKPDARDNVRLVQQAWEYMDSTKQVVWSGAWNAKNTGNKMWVAKPMAILTTRRFIDRGISSAYLMFFNGKTSLYEVENNRSYNGKLNEWSYPGFQKILTSGPDGRLLSGWCQQPIQKSGRKIYQWERPNGRYAEQRPDKPAKPATYHWLDCNNLYNLIGGATGRSFTSDSSEVLRYKSVKTALR